MTSEILASPRPLGVAARRASGLMRPPWLLVAATGIVTLYVTQSQGVLNIYIMNTVLLAVIGAVALNLLMGTAGQPSIGNAAFLAVGGYSAVFVLRTEWFSFPVDVVIAAVVSASVGVVVGLPALRLQGLHLILATLATHFIVLFVASRYQSRAVGEAGFVMTPEFTDRGLETAQLYWAWLLFAIVAGVILLTSRVVVGRSGRAWRMIRDNELAASTLGMRPTRYKLSGFALSSGLIGLQGALLAHFTGSVTVEAFTLVVAIQYIAMILIGGLDSVTGAVIGAVIVTYIPTKMPDIIANFVSESDASTKGPQVSVILYGVLIIVFITSSPQGIVGWFKSSRFGRRLRDWHRSQVVSPSAEAMPRE